MNYPVLRLRLLPAFAITLFLDGISKFMAEAELIPFTPVEVIGNVFRFTLGYNTGVAFGLFSDYGQVMIWLTGFIIIGLTIWFLTLLLRGELSPLTAYPIGMVLGGAVGNFIDRLPDGRVTDFLDVGWGTLRWPTFNVADSFILIGLALLILLPQPEEPKQEQEQTEESHDIPPS